ncbi:phage major tail tube protein [uncultured Sphingomonas sp.]|uniref:phage major tail tube protein n=1 Tax=uncultured Sphingomonas sp. TaxID=158754 RepID=UPI0025F30147|nr:phage major tail tube protein [uncultured Sphingomonas sp.]
MTFPTKLKQMMMFNAGAAFVGETVEITPPKLTRKLEEYRAGGMNRPVKVDMGGEALEMEATYGGPMRQILRQHAMLSLSGVQQRFVGSFQNDDTGNLDAIEIVTRGRHEEIDMGNWKPGDDTEFKVKSQLSYYKLSWNGEVVIEIDVLGMVELVGGVDLMAAHRAVLGI